MTFTPHQIEALDALEGEFGPTDPYLHNVTSREHVDGPYGYEHWITRSLTEALRSWGQYKYALSVDWGERERVEREKREAAYAERAEGVRENLVMGLFTGLMTKASRVGDVAFDSVGSAILLSVRETGGTKVLFQMAYVKETRMLETAVDAKVFTEDLTMLAGHTRPREQVMGLDHVHTYLEGLSADAGE